MTIPVPIFADNESIRFEIREDDRVLERLNVTGFQSGSRPVDAAALIVAEAATPLDLSVRVAGETGHGTAAPVFLRIGEDRRRHRFHGRRPRSISSSNLRGFQPTGSGTRRCARC